MKLLCTIFLIVAAARAAEMPASRPAEETEQRRREMYDRLIRRIEPTGRGDAARLPQYLDFFRREFVEDTRTFAFDVKAEGTILHGFVEFPEHKQALARLLEHLGLVDVKDQTELLPAASLGERKYAFVIPARVFVYDRPGGENRKVLTECVQGEVVFLLKDVEGGQVLCHAPDGYVGYVTATALRRVDEPTVSQIDALQPTRRAADVERVIETATVFIGTKYVWGGGTKEGIDCSGLVREAFRSVRLNLPRDADQQFLVGRLVGTRWYRSGLRRGDTLYFLGHRGQIHHTALYIGDNKFIEATEPVAKISSFDPDDPAYAEKRDHSFCFAKRILE
jgi:hypothetical protein